MMRSLAGDSTDGAISRDRPFRNPHHSASMAALVGGGLKSEAGRSVAGPSGRPVPGRVAGIPARRAGQSAPADRDRRSRGGARQCPCALSRALPAGGGDESLPLRLSLRSGAGLRPRTQMRPRLSERDLGPLFDRIDLHVEVPAVAASDLALPPPREGSAEVAARVAKARDLQRARLPARRRSAPMPKPKANCWTRIATPDAGGRQASHRGGRADAAVGARLSPGAAGGAHHRGSGGRAGCRRVHVAEALSYRRIAPARS